MTVAELIQELSSFPGDVPVYLTVRGDEAPLTQLLWEVFPTGEKRVTLDDYYSDKT